MNEQRNFCWVFSGNVLTEYMQSVKVSDRMNCTKYALRQLLFYILQESKPKTKPFMNKQKFNEAKEPAKWDSIVRARVLWYYSQIILIFLSYFNHPMLRYKWQVLIIAKGREKNQMRFYMQRSIATYRPQIPAQFFFACFT